MHGDYAACVVMCTCIYIMEWDLWCAMLVVLSTWLNVCNCCFAVHQYGSSVLPSLQLSTFHSWHLLSSAYVGILSCFPYILIVEYNTSYCSTGYFTMIEVCSLQYLCSSQPSTAWFVAVCISLTNLHLYCWDGFLWCYRKPLTWRKFRGCT